MKLKDSLSVISQRSVKLSVLFCGILFSLMASALAAHAATTVSQVPTSQACHTRRNNTAAKLLECIQQAALWQHLVDFQTIADQNPDANGHGNRDPGSPGYKASVSYVANLMRQAGYQVRVQTYQLGASRVTGVPQFTLGGRQYAAGQGWSVARLTGGGTVTAPVQAVGGSGSGCTTGDYATFRRGSIAVLRRGSCAYDVQVARAEAGGASAVILHEGSSAAAQATGASLTNAATDIVPAVRSVFHIRLTRPASIPVIAVAASDLDDELNRRMSAGDASSARLEVRTQPLGFTDYNVIADSPYGDPNHVVVVEAHLDSIFGAGILDNASGSATILEIAANMANTPTRNHLRYAWFGGEELGLFGSAFYTTHLPPAERNKIKFDIDVDVTATPNYTYLVADPRFASNVNQFPPNVVAQSGIGNQMFLDYFMAQGVPAKSALFGNDGTDSNSFSLVGIPNSGILTNQDCCKTPAEVAIWGGLLGNYEGHIPSFDGGCVDNPGVYCDNLSNNDPGVFEVASKAAAYAAWGIANFNFEGGRR